MIEFGLVTLCLSYFTKVNRFNVRYPNWTSVLNLGKSSNVTNSNDWQNHKYNGKQFISR